MWKSVLMRDLLLRAHLPPGGLGIRKRSARERASAAGSFFFYCQAIKICMEAKRPTAWKPGGEEAEDLGLLRGRSGVYDIIAEEHDLSVAHARVSDERGLLGCASPWKRLTEHPKLWRCRFSTAWFSTNARAVNTNQTVWRERVLSAVSLVNRLMTHHLN